MALIILDAASIQLDLPSAHMPEWYEISENEIINGCDTETSDAFVKLFEALYVEDSANVLTAKIESLDVGGDIFINTIQNIYSFSLQAKDGVLNLCFGGNRIPIISYSNKKFTVTDNVTIEMSAKDMADKNSLANFTLVHEDNYFPVYGVTDFNFWDLAKEKTIDAIATKFKSLGGGSYAKLVDFVRPFAEKNIIKLPRPIYLDVVAWDIQDHEEYGKSYLFTLNNAPTAVTADGKEINPKYVAINKSFLAFKLMESPEMTRNGQTTPSFAERALTAIQNGGKLLLVITACHPKEPKKFFPQHNLIIIPNEKVLTSEIQERLTLASF